MSMMQSETSRTAMGPHGLGATEEEIVVDFVSGLPGFPASRRFVFEDLGEHLRPFTRIRSLDEPTIAFTVVPPGLLFGDYTIEIDEDHVTQLDLSSADDAMILVIITVPSSPGAPTANLLGPLVINRHSRLAAQVVQHKSSHGVAVPIRPAA